MKLQSISLPGTLDALEPMAAYLAQISQQAGLDKKAAYKLRLAVDEIVTNIITHGYEETGLKGTIEFSSRIEGENLILVVDDQATPFDPLKQAPKPVLNGPFHERPIGGLGVFFAQENVDQFIYEFVDNHNRNIFIVKVNPATVTANHTQPPA